MPRNLLQLLVPCVVCAMACGESSGRISDEAPTDSLSGDVSSTSGRVLLSLSHTRELRGLWVSTVSNLDFPSRPGLSATQVRAEVDAIVSTAADAGFNALFVQVRPESDALYRSTKEPWSRVLSGRQGQDPGYDPLQLFIDTAHAQGLELHAWMNPYRALVNRRTTAHEKHISRVLSQDAVPYGSGVTMNPASTAVRAWVVNEVKDVVSRYDVDGIHFDDYFYPYPVTTTTGLPDGGSVTSTERFDDARSYAAYTADGGTSSLKAWRRSNVNALVRDVSQAVAATKPHVRFGISPFGIYRPGMPAGIVGLDAYDTLACDAVEWLEQGWVDYVAPQLYWPSTQAAQAFGPLVRWWSQTAFNAGTGRYVFPGLGLYRSFGAEEYGRQVALARAERPSVQGALWFTYGDLADASTDVAALLKKAHANPAASPPVASRRHVAFRAPAVRYSGERLWVFHETPGQVKAYALYRHGVAGWTLQQLFWGGAQRSLSLPAGRYAVSALDRASVESLAVVQPVP